MEFLNVDEQLELAQATTVYFQTLRDALEGSQPEKFKAFLNTLRKYRRHRYVRADPQTEVLSFILSEWRYDLY